MFGLIAEDKQNMLMELQSNIVEHVDNPGNISFNAYRAHKSVVRKGDEPMRFVDGEVIESFLDCDPQLQEECVKGLGVSVDEVKEMVEALRRLH